MVLLTACTLAAGSATNAQAAEPPDPATQPSWHFLLDFIKYGHQTNPPGMNNWRCKLRRHNPRPVILVHGTFVSQSSSWGSFSPALHNQGFCVFGLTYSALDLPFLPWRIGGMTGIPQGADELAAFVSRVRKATGANKVDLVGHSQGGTVIAYYLKFRGGARSTANAISLAGPVYPPQADSTVRLFSDLSLAFTTFQMGLLQQANSPSTPRAVFTDLNHGGIAVSGPQYTTITTRYDEIAFPREISVIPANKPATRVRNLLLQDICPNDYADHISLAADPNALALIRNVLRPRFAKPIKCRRVLPVFGVDDAD